MPLIDMQMTLQKITTTTSKKKKNLILLILKENAIKQLILKVFWTIVTNLQERIY